jgi:hypothetical protein
MAGCGHPHVPPKSSLRNLCSLLARSATAEVPDSLADFRRGFLLRTSIPRPGFSAFLPRFLLFTAGSGDASECTVPVGVAATMAGFAVMVSGT